MPYKNPTPSFKDIQPNDIDSENDYSSKKDIYFAFTDVLGFKKAFDDMKISHDEKVSEKYREVFNYYFALMNSAKFMVHGSYTGCYAGQTSDSLYFYTDRIDYLFQFIKIFSHFCLYAMTQNVFLRGGIAKGSLFTKEQYQFYGDSVIGAYLLESNVSKNPIIIVDKKTDTDLRDQYEYDRIISSLASGRTYIKPFGLLFEPLPLDLEDTFIQKNINSDEVHNNIEKNKQIFEYDPNNYSKYVFLENELDATQKKYEELKNKEGNN